MTKNGVSRNWTAHAKRDYALLLIDEILTLGEQTHPERGEITSINKDHKTWKALVHMRELCEVLVGWALHHQVGLGLKGLSNLRPAPSVELRENPAYKDRLSVVNSHQHEEAGASAFTPEEDGCSRQVMVNLLRANPGAFPRELTSVLIEGLEALEFGEVRPILRKRDENRKARLIELRLQLKAVALVHYQFAKGVKKLAAFHQVGTAYGQDPETVRGWEKNARKALGHLTVTEAIEDAKNAAILGCETNDPHTREIIVSTYETQAVKKAGAEYRSFLDSKDRAPNKS
jgi:hypothetical protein